MYAEHFVKTAREFSESIVTVTNPKNLKKEVKMKTEQKQKSVNRTKTTPKTNHLAIH